LQPDGSGRSTDELSRVLLADNTLFEVYRTAESRATSLIVTDRDRAARSERLALIVLLLTFLVGTATAVVRTRTRRRRLRTAVLDLIRRLLSTIKILRSGDLSARVPVTGVV
jgi:hypothetical protein